MTLFYNIIDGENFKYINYWSAKPNDLELNQTYFPSNIRINKLEFNPKNNQILENLKNEINLSIIDSQEFSTTYKTVNRREGISKIYLDLNTNIKSLKVIQGERNIYQIGYVTSLNLSINMILILNMEMETFGDFLITEYKNKTLPILNFFNDNNDKIMEFLEYFDCYYNPNNFSFSNLTSLNMIVKRFNIDEVESTMKTKYDNIEIIKDSIKSLQRNGIRTTITQKGFTLRISPGKISFSLGSYSYLGDSSSNLNTFLNPNIVDRIIAYMISPENDKMELELKLSLKNIQNL